MVSDCVIDVRNDLINYVKKKKFTLNTTTKVKLVHIYDGRWLSGFTR